MKPLLYLLLRMFSGKISAAIASVILYGVLFCFGKVAAACPQIAATIDPNAVANWVFGATIAAINIAANKFHLDNLDQLSAAMSAQAGTLAEPVRRAEKFQTNIAG